MEILENYCTKNSRYKANQKFTPIGVVLHSIGCPQPNAAVLQKSWANNATPYVTHYVLDDAKILHTMPDDRKCWHVGRPGNAKWLGVEMCEPDTIRYLHGAKFAVKDRAAARAYCQKTYKNAVWLLAKLCKEHGWNPQTAILTHGEITRKKLSKTDHVDPEHLWNGLGLNYTLTTLRRDVAEAMGESTPTLTVEVESARSYLKSIKGTYKVTASSLNVRAGAGTKHPILVAIPKDTKVQNYGYYTVANDDMWFYIQVTHKGNTYTGFCSSKYLKMV